MRAGGRRALAALTLAAALTAGCGGGGADVAAAPDDCLRSWNEDERSQAFGRHVYETHESHRAQVAMLETTDGNPNVAAGGACAAIFAVPESDYEYGAVGLVMTDLGWASMQELARGDQAELERVQGEASSAVNAQLLPDGTLAAD